MLIARGGTNRRAAAVAVVCAIVTGWTACGSKLGQLFLQRGLWDGERLVSEAYVQRATSFRVRTTSNEEYGYLWWRRTAYRGAEPVQTFYAIGNGGQHIIVAPSLDLVAVFTGTNFDSPATSTFPQGLFDRYVLAGIR